MEAEDRKDFTKKVKITTAIVSITVLAVLLLVYTVKVFLMAFAAMMVAIFFRSIAGFLSKKTGLGRAWTLPASVIAILLIWAGVFFLLQPKVSTQLNLLSKQLPKAAAEVEQQLKQSKTGRFLLKQIPFDVNALKDSMSEKGATDPSVPEGGNEAGPPTTSDNKLGSFFKKFFSSTLGVLGDVYVIFLFSLFFMANPAPYRKGIVALFPPKNRQRMKEVIKACGITLRLWLFGKMLSMLVVAVLTVIGLQILGVPLFITLALLAGLLSFIPNFGPLIAIVPAFLVGYVQSPSMGLYVVLLYIGIQTVESNLITPFIMKRQIQVPLAMTLFSQVLLALLVGGLGLIFATPIVALFMVIIQMLYIEDALGDESIEVKGEQLAKKKVASD